MKLALSVLAMTALAGTATADVVLTGGSGRVLQTNLVLSPEAHSAGGGSDVSIKRYDEWTAPPSVLNAIMTSGTQEIADDLSFIAQPGAGLLTNLGFSIANSNGPAGSSMTGGSVRITFYDLTTGLVVPSVGGFTSFTAGLPAVALAPGGSTRVSFGAAGAQALNNLGLGWYLPAGGVYASMAYLTATGTGGFTIANAGIQLRNGGTIGTSTDSLVGVNAGPQPTGPFNFAGAPYADNAWFIETNDIPAPGSIAILGLGGLLAARRRRS